MFSEIIDQSEFGLGSRFMFTENHLQGREGGVVSFNACDWLIAIIAIIAVF